MKISRQQLNQAMILLTGIPAIFLTQVAQPELAKFACIFGLLGQPFWIHAALDSRQWGTLVITLLYTVAWAAGLMRFWILPALGYAA